MQIELRPIDSIKPYDRNPRVNEPAVDAVAESIKAFGFRQAIVVDEHGVIICGHTRYKAALKLGLQQVPVHVAVDLPPDKVKAYRIADNKSAELSDWDYNLLPVELGELQEMNYDLASLGFSEEELAKILDTGIKEGLTDPDQIPEPPDDAITQLGDTWVLGQHRLHCGDATTGAMAELLQGQQAHLMFTDPPWNVGIGTDSNPRHRQRPGLMNDDLHPEQFQTFLTQFAAQASRHVSGDVYCVLGASEWPTLDLALRNAGYHWSATIIWVKDIFVLGRSKFHRRYEPIWYGWHEEGKSSFQGRRDVDDVWEVARPKRSEEHPTMKPVEVIIRALEYCSGPGALVLDPFGGSGSTLIAAEQTGRKCYTLEIDPKYCDVIVSRWEEFTGKKAERISTS